MTAALVQLGELVTIVGGGTPARGEPAYWGPEIPWATVKDMVGLELSATQEGITRAGLQNSAASLVPAGSIVIATRMGLGKAAINTIDLAINQDLKALNCRPDVEPRYLLHFLVSVAPRIEAMGEGATVKGVTLDHLTGLCVPVPTIAEQQRIAAILDKADGIRRKRRETLRLLDDFLRSAFLETFGNPVKNEKGWRRARASSVIEAIEPGSSIKGEEREPSPGEWSVLKISAVTSGWYLPGERKVVAAPPHLPVVPRRGDLLLSRANTRDLVAATCLVDRDEPRLFLPDKLWRITPNADMATVEYLRFLLADPHFRQTLTRHATGTSGSMLNVSQEKLLRLDLPLPPLARQQHFGSLIWRVFETRGRVNAAADGAAELFDSLAQRAFRAQS